MSEEKKSGNERFALAMKAVSPIVKNSTNPFHKNKYANLEACLDAVKGALEANDLYLVQNSTLICSEPHLTLISVESRVHDIDGSVIQRSSVILPLKETTPQGGAALNTYGRRYSLKSLFALAEEDDDGNTASLKTAKEVAVESIRKSVGFSDIHQEQKQEGPVQQPPVKRSFK
jgi:hypothetical protein